MAAKLYTPCAKLKLKFENISENFKRFIPENTNKIVIFADWIPVWGVASAK